MKTMKMFQMMFLVGLANVACVADGPLPVETPDATVPASPDGKIFEPNVCHGLIGRFTPAQVATLDHCLGWSVKGASKSLAVGVEVVGGDSVCAITCYTKEPGQTVVPNECSGTWLPGGTSDVPRWNKPGCKRLPDHNANEADQAGCTWDGRCDDPAPTPSVDGGIPTPDASTPNAPTLSFTANPSTINAGQSSTLSWTSANTTSCNSSGGAQPTNGSWTVNPTTTTTYTLTCNGPGGQVTRTVTVTVNAAPTNPVCHGLIVDFAQSDVSRMTRCSGWTATGAEVSYTKGQRIVGNDGTCAITCACNDGGNVLPTQVSGVWLPDATMDVPRWYTAGCKRLPGHPANEADQAGGTWDKRCDKY